MALRGTNPLLPVVFILLLTHTGAFRSVCYYSNWAQYRVGKGKYFPENINPDMCTHIIYAFAKPDGLDLKKFEWNDDDTPWAEGMYKRVLKIKQRAPHIKFLLAVGGWKMSSAPFIPLVQTPQSRSTFAQNAIAFLRQRNFEGFDMDWEYPAARGSTPGDKPKFQLLMEEMMRAFREEATRTGRSRLLLTVAVPAGKANIDNGYFVANLSRTVDFISIMTYDFHGSWDPFVAFNSPLYAYTAETGNATRLNVDWVARYYVSLGAPKEVLNIGIATYGRSFTLADPNRHSILSPSAGMGTAGPSTQEAGVLAYYEICDMFRGAQIVQVPSQKNPYRVKGNQWVGYDDIPSVRAKACYASTNGYGGILFWTIDFDDFDGSSCNEGPYPLLTAAYNAMRSPLTVCGTNSPAPPQTRPASPGTTPTVGVVAPRGTTPIVEVVPPRSENSDALRSVCYYSNWAQYRPGKGKYLPENINPDMCTHIIYAFAKPDGLDLKPYEWNDDDSQWAEGMFKRVLKIKQRAPHIKFLLAVGGWKMGSQPFIPLVQTPQSRSTFSRNAIAFLRQRNFEGFDMDWEYPGGRGSTPGDKPKFQLLMEEMMRAFKEEASNTGKSRLLLTVAVPAGKTNIDNGYFVANLSRTVDFISIMSYDLHGVWENVTGINSPLYAHTNETGNATQLNVDWVAKYYVSLGAPKKLLNIGIATYGRSFTLQDPNRHSVLSPSAGMGTAGPHTNEGGILAYYEICDMFQGGRIVQVPSQRNPYLVKGNQWVGYDDVVSVAAKACYASKNGYGGILFWTMDLDDFNGLTCEQGPYPLLTAAYDELKRCGTKDLGVESPPGCSFLIVALTLMLQMAL